MKISKNEKTIINKCDCLNPKQIKETLPIFYEENKEAIDDERILVYLDYFATEGGIVLNNETSEAYSVDLRA